MKAADQPISTELHIADGVFVKTMVIQRAGTFVPQHAHVYAHVTVLVRGSIKAWKDGAFLGDFTAPVGITIPARAKHLFMSLEDHTILLCVHDIGTAEAVEIAEEHQIVEG